MKRVSTGFHQRKKVPENRGGRSGNFILARVAIALTYLAIKTYSPEFTLSVIRPTQVNSLPELQWEPHI